VNRRILLLQGPATDIVTYSGCVKANPQESAGVATVKNFQILAYRIYCGLNEYIRGCRRGVTRRTSASSRVGQQARYP
jgi:hypothetical protein